MLSGVLQVFLLISSLAVVSSVHFERKLCSGDQLSARNNSQVAQLVDNECTHVLGPIVIANLTNVNLPVHIYRRVVHVAGSIVIWNNTNITSSVHFPQLHTVNATDLPAIVILANRNVHFSVGDHFRKAITHNSNITFAVLLNNPSISTAQYNLLYVAGYPHSKFVTDSLHGSRICLENLFKPLAGILGFLFVFLTAAFSTVAFYDRKN